MFWCLENDDHVLEVDDHDDHDDHDDDDDDDLDKNVSITGATATYDPDTSKNVSPYDYPDHSRPLQTSGVWSTKSDLENDQPYGRQNAVKRPPNSKNRNLLWYGTGSALTSLEPSTN